MLKCGTIEDFRKNVLQFPNLCEKSKFRFDSNKKKNFRYLLACKFCSKILTIAFNNKKANKNAGFIIIADKTGFFLLQKLLHHEAENSTHNFLNGMPAFESMFMSKFSFLH
jgi:hypothetical protein